MYSWQHELSPLLKVIRVLKWTESRIWGSKHSMCNMFMKTVILRKVCKGQKKKKNLLCMGVCSNLIQNSAIVSKIIKQSKTRKVWARQGNAFCIKVCNKSPSLQHKLATKLTWEWCMQAGKVISFSIISSVWHNQRSHVWKKGELSTRDKVRDTACLPLRLHDGRQSVLHTEQTDELTWQRQWNPVFLCIKQQHEI